MADELSTARELTPKELLKIEILRALKDLLKKNKQPSVAVLSDSGLKRVLTLGIPCSKTQFKRALGSLVHDGDIVRSRPLPETRDSHAEVRLITFSVAAK